MPAGGGGEKGWKGSRRTHRKGEKGGGSDGETKGPGGGPGAAVKERGQRSKGGMGPSTAIPLERCGGWLSRRRPWEPNRKWKWKR